MAGRRVSFASLAAVPIADVPGVPEGIGRRLALGLCHANPYNRDIIGDLSDLAGIAERQLQSALAISVDAFVRLWPEDRDRFGNATSEDVVIVSGNRRLAAARKYGRNDLIVIVDDSLATSRAAVMRAAFDENTNRQDLDPIEEAKAVGQIVAEYSTAKEAAEAQGWSQTWISERKSLLKLRPELQDQVRSHAAGGPGIAINVARRLGTVKGVQQMSLAQQESALADLLRGDAVASESKKRARRATRLENNPAPESSESSIPVGTGEFSAENSPAPTPAGATRTVAEPLDWTSPSKVADFLIGQMTHDDLHTLVKFLQVEFAASENAN